MTSLLATAEAASTSPAWVFWLPLAGVLIGGLLSVLGQWLAARSTQKSAEKMAALAEARDLRQAERAAITELLTAVAADLRAVTERFDASNDAPEDTIAACDVAMNQLAADKIERGALTALVDPHVEEAAADVYTSWCFLYELQKAQAKKEPNSEVIEEQFKRALDSQDVFNRAARSRLEALRIEAKEQ